MDKSKLKDLKNGGFMKQVQKDMFAMRLRIPVGNITPDQMRKLADVADKYGQSKVHITTRQSIEIQFIHFDDFEEVVKDLAEVGLAPGSCGPRMRNIVSCPGTTVCSYGILDTVELGMQIDKQFFGREFPVKIKAAISGCPNSCAKPQENDLGLLAICHPDIDHDLCTGCGICAEVCDTGAITMSTDNQVVFDKQLCRHEGNCIRSCPLDAWYTEKAGYKVYLGGKIGRNPQLGEIICELLPQKDVLNYLETVLEVLLKDAQLKKGERVGTCVNRVGLDTIKKAISSRWEG